jgi:UDP-N-acetylmuramoyl-tripeptide--D-alanyl-D-alanine ligase
MIWLKFIIFTLGLVRILRWTSILQQKEYRFDRWLLFLQSGEGKKELLRVVVLPLRFFKLKRPRLTLKSIVLLGFLTLEWSLVFGLRTWILVLIYLLIPVICLVNGLALGLPTRLIVWYWANKARSMIIKKSPTIIGITGSYGKTTTKLLIKKLLKEKFSVWATPKSFNNLMSVAKAINDSYKGEKFMVVEYGAYKKGEIELLTKFFKPNIAVITGITEQHLGLFGDKVGLVAAKSELLKALPLNSYVFYNADDTGVKGMVKPFLELKLIPHEKIDMRKTNLIGSHFQVNVGLAVAVARHFGLNNNQIEKSLDNFVPGEEFISLKRMGNRATLIVDDKTSNPAGFEAAIGLLRSMKANKKAIIASGVVDLGDESTRIHRKLAGKIKEACDYFIHTSDLEEKVLKRELGSKYKQVHSLNELDNFLKTFGENDLVLLEGNIPPHLKKLVLGSK